jgi:hypothetical protein
MSIARTVLDGVATVRSRSAGQRDGDSLLGLALLFMLCAAETTWLIAGTPESANIAAAAEGVYLPQ